MNHSSNSKKKKKKIQGKWLHCIFFCLKIGLPLICCTVNCPNTFDLRIIFLFIVSSAKAYKEMNAFIFNSLSQPGKLWP